MTYRHQLLLDSTRWTLRSNLCYSAAMQARDTMHLFEKKYKKALDVLQPSEMKAFEDLNKRLKQGLRFTGALYLEGLLVLAATESTEAQLAVSTAEEQIRKLAAESVDRSLVHPTLIKKAESLVR